MKFGYKAFIATAALVGGLGLGASAASAMPVAAIAAPADIVVHADKAAVLCIGSCYRRYAYRPAFRPAFRAYAPYGYYRSHRQFGYYR